MTPEGLLGWAWLAWVISWGLAAFWSARSVRAAGWRAEMVYRLAIVAGCLLQFGDYLQWYRGARVLWTLPAAAAWAAVAVALAGLLFTWWARVHLGRLWSGWVTAKEGHRIVDTGPYALVRHPIYTGLLAAMLATALLKATAPALAGAALFVLAFWLKARLEERFLERQLGRDSYAAYRARVPMLLPLKFPSRSH